MLQFLVPGLYLFFEFSLLVEELLLDLKHFLFFDNLGVLVGGLHHFVVFSLDDMHEEHVSGESSQDEAYDSDDYCYDIHFK